MHLVHTHSYVTCRDEQKSPQKLAEENHYHDINNPLANGYLPGQGNTSTDLIGNPPELPDREYFEDIDFVSQEFDLFFRHRPNVSSSLTEKEKSRKGDDGIELEVLDSSHSEQPVKDKYITEASHYMSLTNGNSDHIYQSLKPGEQPSASVNVCEESSLENHYQALSEATKHCDSNLYQSLSFSHTSSNSREQPGRDKCTTEASHYNNISLINGDSENAYQPLKPGKQQSASVNV